MRRCLCAVGAALALSSLGACDLVPQGMLDEGYDPDGDGVPWPEDCDSSSADIYPGAPEIWYDGIDQDCGGDDDFDQDLDGWVPGEHQGQVTAGVEGSGALPSGDCWDALGDPPEEFTVVPSSLEDSQGQALSWAQPTAAEVNPDASEVWYDGIDQDCDGADDLDQDGDGWRSSGYPDAGGVFGEDCIDGSDLDSDNHAGDAAVDVNPDASEVWYDGTDQDCDGNDCDQDGDGASADPGDAGYCEVEDCDDTDPEVIGGGSDETWYDGSDQDCDGNDGDQDGDGYWVSDYDELVAAAGGDPLTVPEGMDGDCWDVPLHVEEVPADFEALGDFEQPDADEVNPAASDLFYDGIDQDCAGDDDFDADNDGSASQDWPDREGATGGDCDDEDPGIGPASIEAWYDGLDQNCDGNDGDQDGDGYWVVEYATRVKEAGGTPLDIPEGSEGDCDDLDPARSPGATESCDRVDNDCDGTVDGPESTDATSWYPDLDLDGYGDPDGEAVDCETPSGHVADGTDCDDTDDQVHPGAEESCDGADQDCDGLVDHDDPDVADASTWYPDVDADGYGDLSDAGTVWCAGSEASGTVTDGTDCDDTDAGINPGQDEYCDGHDDDCDGTVDEADALDATTWYPDADADGYGDASLPQDACDQPSGHVADASDCDDSAAGANPGATELCDGFDNDCDGTVDESDALDASTWYTDADVDGYGDDDSTSVACSAPSGSVSVGGDCDDGDAAVNPGASEICNDVDDDCDDAIDDSAVDASTWYADADGDSYGDASSSQVACDDPSEGETSYTVDSSDCDDSDAAINPAATETCSGVDDDCDGLLDDDDPSVDLGTSTTWYSDADGDSYGDSGTGVESCSPPSGAVVDASDCDDADATINPGADEYCDGHDDDCDGAVDESDALDASTWYQDADFDGYGDAATSSVQCSQPSGYVADSGDCDDTLAATYPGAVEVVADGVDNDCSGGDSCFEDSDGDAYGTTVTVLSDDLDCSDSGESSLSTDCDDSDAAINPGATEICDSLDDDCDGLTDDDDDSVDSSGFSTFYADGDGDGYGDSDSSTSACDQPSGHVTDASDCDDTDADSWPGADEYCDGHDDDCDGTVDESDAVDVSTWYADADSDSYGDASSSQVLCDQPSGYVADASDCDDTDASISPAATEVFYDGVDQDCAGDDDYDADADGDQAEAWGGADCDDGDAGVSSLATEICVDGIDQDCDGDDPWCEGDLLITEIMADPDALADTDGEWFEIVNNSSASTIPLQDLVIRDADSDLHVMSSTLSLAPGEVAVLARSADATDDPDYLYESFTLTNTGDEIIVAMYGSDGTDGAVIDQVAYDGGISFPAPTGATLTLEPTAYDPTDNDDGAWWCPGGSTMSSGDLGTPGAENDSCIEPTIATVEPDEGLAAGGLDLTITGRALDVVTSVTFDGVEASFSLVDFYELDAITPAGAAGYVDVTVASDSASDTLSAGFFFSGLSSAVDECRTVTPTSTSATVGSPTTTLYALVYVAGVTDSTGAGAGVDYEVGYGDPGSDPSSSHGWAWIAGRYDGDNGSYDQIEGTLTVDSAGSYAYAWRFSVDAGLNWLYCDTGGTSPSDPYDTADEASLEVTP